MEDWIIGLGVVLTLLLSVTIAYQLGRHVEEQFWKTSVPQEMMKLCTECAGLRTN